MNTSPVASALVSIVTPFHNTVEYLEKCIRSVLAQTYQNWEYILVNNHSTDGSFELALRYAQLDPRIRVISQKTFLNQVENYNSALAQISPESVYCKVVQADDMLFPDCLAAMIELANANQRVGIVSSYYMNGEEVRNVGLPLESKVVTGEEACRRHLLLGQFLFGTATTILIRSCIVRGRMPFYAQSTTMEDTEACYEILSQWQFGFVHQVLSFSRVDKESITSRLLPLNPYTLDHLILIKRFGVEYLTPREYEGCLAKTYREYRRFLARSLLRRQPSSFWDYHRRGLARIGIRISRLSLVPYAMALVVKKVFQPWLLLDWVVCQFRVTPEEFPFSPTRPQGRPLVKSEVPRDPGESS